MKKSIALLLLMAVFQTTFSQNDEEWKPQTHITGYVNTIAEYTDLQNWVDAKQNFGIGLSEAAFLVSYKPLHKLEFKGTFVYAHKITEIQSLLVEAYGTYTISDKLKLSAGKYLTPLSPVNQYFYAPLNPSATLPMLVSHHFMLPQSISGFQISGEMGSDIKAGYNVTYGHYMSGAHMEQGIIGLQGREDLAGYVLSNPIATKQYKLGGSARIFGNYKDILNLGLNYFDGRQATLVIHEKVAAGSPFKYIPSSKFSAGVDLELKVGGLKANAEYWYGENETTDLPENITNKYYAYYGEIIYDFGIVSPYIRFDYVDDAKDTSYDPFPTNPVENHEYHTQAFTAGLAVRPIYEILMKFEYRNVKIDYLDNPLNIQYDNYNHLIMSLVYSF